MLRIIHPLLLLNQTNPRGMKAINARPQSQNICPAPSKEKL